MSFTPQQSGPLSRADQLSIDAPPSLVERVRDIHHYLYANEGIKQFAKISDEIIKLIFTKLSIDDGNDVDENLADSEIATASRSAFQRAVLKTRGIQAFEADDALKLSDAGIAFAIRRLGSDPLRDRDPKGVAFQAILGPTLRGELGQFFTPDPVKTLLTHLTRPRTGDICCDPASGTGGLLLEARQFQPGCRVKGVEVDSSLARLARLNLYMAGESNPEIHRLDALQPLGQIFQSSSGQLSPGCCDVVISNPPFGSRGKVSNPEILSDLENVAGGKQSVAPEILFIERIVQLLRPGGRAGIVLPIGVLSNPSTTHVRNFLRSVGRIYATVALPLETFKPTGNSVQAAIVCFERTIETPSVSYPVFRALSRSIGYNHRGRPDKPADTDKVLRAWDDFTDAFSREYRWAS